MTSIRPNVSGREQSIRRNTPSVRRSEFDKSKSTLCNVKYDPFPDFAVQSCTEPSARYKQCERPLWGPKQGH